MLTNPKECVITSLWFSTAFRAPSLIMMDLAPKRTYMHDNSQIIVTTAPILSAFYVSGISLDI